VTLDADRPVSLLEQDMIRVLKERLLKDFDEV
jgi:hypothetical protein